MGPRPLPQKAWSRPHLQTLLSPLLLGERGPAPSRAAAGFHETRSVKWSAWPCAQWAHTKGHSGAEAGLRRTRGPMEGAAHWFAPQHLSPPSPSHHQRLA